MEAGEVAAFPKGRALPGRGDANVTEKRGTKKQKNNFFTGMAILAWIFKSLF